GALGGRNRVWLVRMSVLQEDVATVFANAGRVSNLQPQPDARQGRAHLWCLLLPPLRGLRGIACERFVSVVWQTTAPRRQGARGTCVHVSVLSSRGAKRRRPCASTQAGGGGRWHGE